MIAMLMNFLAIYFCKMLSDYFKAEKNFFPEGKDVRSRIYYVELEKYKNKNDVS